MKASLFRADLRYPHLQLHTASSGSINGLDELYLLLEDKNCVGIGEVRINIAYLNGYSAKLVLGDVIHSLRQLDLQRSASEILLTLETLLADRLAPTRMLFDMAFHDLIARQNGCSVAKLIGSDFPNPVCYATNQTLFWSSQEQMLSQATAYMERGFNHLKLRIGIGSLEEDCDRMAALRRRFGSEVHLSADANGQWHPEQARSNLLALQKFELSYLEQPVADTYAHYYPALADASPIPLMLDESMSTAADLERILAMKGKVWAHLKLVKMGGIAPTVRAARRLHAAGVPFMVGQMNEGAAATAAALHVAYACQPAHAELYGADGLSNDPVSGLNYQQGLVSSSDISGLGIEFDPDCAELIQTFSS
ncbi:mandelate racemase/muconate lactonizing enzyme family protein [Rouxiella sp. T17]|uniref:mandelate racemase/muconate lactonizing enzyme family protein n=1 Tax=Rouxiella sp. T17 TaxID=3085684 RepID=UPI002FCA4A42